jgi:hypothetical protein
MFVTEKLGEARGHSRNNTDISSSSDICSKRGVSNALFLRPMQPQFQQDAFVSTPSLYNPCAMTMPTDYITRTLKELRKTTKNRIRAASIRAEI